MNKHKSSIQAERDALKKEAESYKVALSGEINGISKSVEQLILRLAAIGGSMFLAYRLLLLFTNKEDKKNGTYNANIFSRVSDLAGEQLMLYVLGLAKDKLADIIDSDSIEENAEEQDDSQ